jgi:hypothetical protein
LASNCFLNAAAASSALAYPIASNSSVEKLALI